MIKFIASDMDGTLLNSKGKIDERVYELISKLKSKGILFAAASGRSCSQLSDNFKNVKVDMLFIAHNGAVIKSKESNKIIYSNQISKENVDRIAKLNSRINADLFLSGADTAYMVEPSENLLREFNDYGVNHLVVNSINKIDEPIYKLTYYVANGDTAEAVEYLRENLGEDLELVLSGEQWIDIMNKGVSKGKAIGIMQERLGIDSKKTMVFGDYYNDVEMFKKAHHSYAMETAPEDVKLHARFILENENEDGVYNVIYKYAASL